MAPNTIVIHTSVLFDSKKKAFVNNMSIEVDPEAGAIVRVFQRQGAEIPPSDPERTIDLRGKVVLPGLVDSHTHIFLHDYRCVHSRPPSHALQDPPPPPNPGRCH